ncbi:MAG: phosphatidylglycerophosphatase A [Chromatiales bacterium]|jgi:phosphatidylglycerophosphatase A|nr:phosphatidylglycerophosphatase A [Chromatiales bacterium]
MKRGPVPTRLLLDPGHALALGFGAGLSSRAPGTVGTAVAIPIYLAVFALSGGLITYLLVVIGISALGIYVSGRTATALGVDDHGGIVVDEIAGFLVTMVAVSPSAVNILVGFAAFRLFDIWKPGPIGWADRHFHGGLGIMADDLLAGIAACLVVHGVQWVTLFLEPGI